MRRRPLGWLRGAFASWALAAAGAVAAWAATPVTPAWSADPDSQFMLDVNIRQLRLGDGVRAYQTPEGTCIVFGDFLATLDVPMKIDLAAKRASCQNIRNHERHGTVGGLVSSHVFEPFGEKTIDISIESRRPREHFSVARPTQSLVALRTIGRHIEEIAALSPLNIRL